jgi:hypothetical protein
VSLESEQVKVAQVLKVAPFPIAVLLWARLEKLQGEIVTTLPNAIFCRQDIGVIQLPLCLGSEISFHRGGTFRFVRAIAKTRDGKTGEQANEDNESESHGHPLDATTSGLAEIRVLATPETIRPSRFNRGTGRTLACL